MVKSLARFECTPEIPAKRKVNTSCLSFFYWFLGPMKVCADCMSCHQPSGCHTTDSILTEFQVLVICQAVQKLLRRDSRAHPFWKFLFKTSREFPHRQTIQSATAVSITHIPPLKHVSSISDNPPNPSTVVKTNNSTNPPSTRPNPTKQKPTHFQPNPPYH
jgi:hypothetical protein